LQGGAAGCSDGLPGSEGVFLNAAVRWPSRINVSVSTASETHPAF
jgi:hypothetical protein